MRARVSWRAPGAVALLATLLMAPLAGPPAARAAALPTPGLPDIPPPPDPYPRAAAAYRVSVNGVVLWERAPDRALPPASLAKIMTGLVLLEEGWDGDAPVTVSPRAAGAPGSRLGLRAGEVFPARDLLAGLLVASGNDACLALAEHRDGTGEAFVARMNRRAARLGLAGTRFGHPCGLDAPGQRTTAADLERLARAALALPDFAALVARPDGTAESAAGRRIAFRTGNQLLGRVPGVTGVKSGYTRQAGKCLVALAEREGDQVLVILLNAPDRWWSAAVLVEDAFRALADARR